MMSLRINEALFLFVIIVVFGAIGPSVKAAWDKTPEERARAREDGTAMSFSWKGAGIGGAVGVPLCLLFLYASRRE